METEEDWLDKVLMLLDERQRTVLKLRFALDGGREMTLKEVGKVLGRSGECVRQIEAKAIRRLRRDQVIKQILGFDLDKPLPVKFRVSKM